MLKYFPDIVTVVGLSLMGYGLFLFKPWVSFAVCGAFLVFAGWRLGRSEGAQS